MAGRALRVGARLIDCHHSIVIRAITASAVIDLKSAVRRTINNEVTLFAACLHHRANAGIRFDFS